MATYLTDSVMATVGASTPPRSGTVTAYDIRKFCAAVDDQNPLCLDPAAARAAGYADVIAPPLFNAAVLRQVPFRSGLLSDGQYETTAPPGLGHLQTMLAGQSWEILRPTVAGEQIQEVFTTKSITEREGRTGPIVFVEKESLVTTLAGEPVERYSSTLILRAPPPPLPPYAQGGPSVDTDRPATEWDGDTMVKNPDMIALFMFAAAIWAVHRVHWDIPYSQKEGLPAPILPGWMMSNYLAQLVEARAPEGQRLGKIDVRYKGPAHPGDRLRCTAEANGQGGIVLLLVNQAGTQLCTGTASYAAR
jgi:acyl dehydratase